MPTSEPPGNPKTENLELALSTSNLGLRGWIPMRSVTIIASKIPAGFFITSLFPIVNADFSTGRCCALAIREDFQTYIDKGYPWTLCNFNQEIDYSTNATFPSILRSLAWCKENCRGTQISHLNQWLLPLATYIAPYVGVLLLCSVGNVEKNYAKAKPSVATSINSAIHGCREVLQEYVSLLGDPASALFGAASEIIIDVRIMANIERDNSNPNYRLRRSANLIRALAGDIKFNPAIRWNMPEILDASQPAEVVYRTENWDQTGRPANNRQSAPTSPPHDAMATLATPLMSKNANANANEDEYDPDTEMRKDVVTEFLDKLDRVIRMLIIARAGFVKGILLPVILLLAVTAATFYDAYAKYGNKETAYSLAYCVWYAWILVLGVASNCFATSLKPSLTQATLRDYLCLSQKKALGVGLRDRYMNARYWKEWVNTSEFLSVEQCQRAVTVKLTWRFWGCFIGGQFLGWCVIAFTCACAAAIAWTTPTVGLGCRSFNFIIYAAFSFATAATHVVHTLVRHTYKYPNENRKSESRMPFLVAAIATIYWLLCACGALILILGTAFHLSGFFRSCWCEALFSDDSTMVELNRKTQEAVDNARRFWISTSYISFGMMWNLCLVAIGCWVFILQSMNRWVKDVDSRLDGNAHGVRER